MVMNTSASLLMTKSALMLMEVKTKKEDQSLYGTTLRELTRDGMLSMLTKLRKKQPKE
jgi:hypothetical protein